MTVWSYIQHNIRHKLTKYEDIHNIPYHCLKLCEMHILNICVLCISTFTKLCYTWVFHKCLGWKGIAPCIQAKECTHIKKTICFEDTRPPNLCKYELHLQLLNQSIIVIVMCILQIPLIKGQHHLL